MNYTATASYGKGGTLTKKAQRTAIQECKKGMDCAGKLPKQKIKSKPVKKKSKVDQESIARAKSRRTDKAIVKRNEEANKAAERVLYSRTENISAKTPGGKGASKTYTPKGGVVDNAENRAKAAAAAEADKKRLVASTYKKGGKTPTTGGKEVKGAKSLQQREMAAKKRTAMLKGYGYAKLNPDSAAALKPMKAKDKSKMKKFVK